MIKYNFNPNALHEIPSQELTKKAFSFPDLNRRRAMYKCGIESQKSVSVALGGGIAEKIPQALGSIGTIFIAAGSYFGTAARRQRMLELFANQVASRLGRAVPATAESLR